MPRPKLATRLWRTLREPRTVTMVMVAIYFVLVLAGISVVTTSTHEGPMSLIAGGAMIIGGTLGAISSWPGWYWLEAPMSLLSVFGLAVLSALRLELAVAADRFPSYPIFLTVLVALFFVTRVLRTWPLMYAPGRGPNRREEAEVAAVLAQEDYERAVQAR